MRLRLQRNTRRREVGEAMSPEAIEDFRRNYREYRADAEHSFVARMALRSLVALAADVPELQAVIDEEEQ